MQVITSKDGCQNLAGSHCDHFVIAIIPEPRLHVFTLGYNLIRIVMELNETKFFYLYNSGVRILNF